MNPKTADKLKVAGYEVLSEIADVAEAKLSVIQMRQVEAVKKGEVIVERGIERELGALVGPLAFLDFETIMPAIPLWERCRPYEFVLAQFSCHVETAQGIQHHEWIVLGRGDRRREAAEALVNACHGAGTILVYNQSFEKSRLKELAELFPDLAAGLLGISARVVDLLPIVRNHVYHPKFHGSFSIKSVLPALCPELSYERLNVKDGGTASLMLEAIMTEPEKFKEGELAQLVVDLREYCKMDTWAMVRLVEVLRGLVRGSAG